MALLFTKPNLIGSHIISQPQPNPSLGNLKDHKELNWTPTPKPNLKDRQKLPKKKKKLTFVNGKYSGAVGGTVEVKLSHLAAFSILVPQEIRARRFEVWIE